MITQEVCRSHGYVRMFDFNWCARETSAPEVDSQAARLLKCVCARGDARQAGGCVSLRGALKCLWVTP